MRAVFSPVAFFAIFLAAGSAVFFSCTPATGPIVVNSAISVRSKTIDRMTLAWSQAQDANGNNETLEYQVVVSESSDIDTVSSVNKNARTVRAWEKNYQRITIDLTGDETVLYYNVMVRDSVGTISFYSPLAVDFTDRTAPVVSDSALTVSEITAKSLRLEWKAAADNNTADNELVYVVMKSPSDNLNGNDAYYNQTEGRHTCYEKASVYTVLLEALDPGSVLWLNVFVRDSNGNVTPYTTVQAVLLPSVTVTADAAGIVYTYPLSVDTVETVTLTASDGKAEGTLPADSPLWTTVVLWAASYSGNAAGQGLYRFENLYNAADGTVSLTSLSETDAKLLSNALTEYTNTYQNPAGNDGCCYLTEAGNAVRTASETGSAVIDEAAAGFRLSSGEGGKVNLVRRISETT